MNEAFKQAVDQLIEVKKSGFVTDDSDMCIVLADAGHGDPYVIGAFPTTQAAQKFIRYSQGMPGGDGYDYQIRELVNDGDWINSFEQPPDRDYDED